MSLNSIIPLSITIASAGISLPGFGTPMVLFQHTFNTDLLRYYTNPAVQMLTDGFSANSQVYRDACAAMAQRPSPQRVAVGRRTAPVAQVDSVAFVTSANGAYTVTITLNGAPHVYTFTAAASTVIQVRDGLIALINAGAIGVTASIGDATHMTLTAGTAGIPFTTAPTASPASDMTVSTTTPNHGIAEDLAAINAVQPDWYLLLLPTRDMPNNFVAAQAIELQSRMFFAQSSDPNIINTAYNAGSPAVDLANDFRALALTRSALWWHATDTESLAAAIGGLGLASPPASINWKFKQLAGVATDVLTDTQVTNLTGKNANGYRAEAGKGITFEGTVGSGQFIDIIHGIDELYSDIQARVLLALLNLPKIPFTDAGLRTIGNQVIAALKATVGRLIAPQRTLSDGTIQAPAFTVTVPLASDISQNDRSLRRIPSTNPIRFEATLDGAVNLANISGTVAS